jgi:hypothetical protein
MGLDKAECNGEALDLSYTSEYHGEALNLHLTLNPMVCPNTKVTSSEYLGSRNSRISPSIVRRHTYQSAVPTTPRERMTEKARKNVI